MHYIRFLTLTEMEAVHRQYMKQDFPANELRPFQSIRTLHEDGRYLGIGLFDNQSALLAYAFFVSLLLNGKTHYLFDYLAVVPGRRDAGLGSEFLPLLQSALSDAESIIVEVENPETEPDETARSVKERRMQFYLRAGTLDTGVCSNLFGVDYRIMEMTVSSPHSKTEIAALYEAIYRSFLPPHVYNRRCHVIIP